VRHICTASVRHTSSSAPLSDDKRASDQRPDACFQGRRLPRPHPYFVTPPATKVGAAVLVLSPNSACVVAWNHGSRATIALLESDHYNRPGADDSYGDIGVVRPSGQVRLSLGEPSSGVGASRRTGPQRSRRPIHRLINASGREPSIPTTAAVVTAAWILPVVDPAEIVAALQNLTFRSYDDLAARSSTAPPQHHGLYAWWQSAGALPGFHGTPHPEDSGFELLYVGTAPKDATSKSNLRRRLGNHHRAAIGSSTFRLDLTAFLWQVQGWRPGWTDRPKLPDDDIAALAEWQRKHLHVQWVEVPKPWDAEKAVVHTMHPPLNRDHNQHHPAYGRVADARDGLRRAARRNPL
jgi:hypothetical protein